MANIIKTTITRVRTVSGAAGTAGGEADVVLRVEGKADTVEAVREYVERAVTTHDALVSTLNAIAVEVLGHRAGNSGATLNRIAELTDAARKMVRA